MNRWAASLDRPAEVDFERLLGPSAWSRLTADIRRRFKAKPRAGEAFSYFGTMGIVACSTAGQLLAQLYRLIGTPLPPYRGDQVPVTIRLYRDRAGGGIVWERRYALARRCPLKVCSTKTLDRDGGLLECIGGGFGMRLRLFERDCALHFLSTGYFCRLGPLKIPIPLLLTPGRTHVIHSDLGGGRFRFTMSIVHPVLGTTFFQDGSFAGEGAAP